MATPRDPGKEQSGGSSPAKCMTLDARREERRLLAIVRGTHRLTLGTKDVKGDALASQIVQELVGRTAAHMIGEFASAAGNRSDAELPHHQDLRAAGCGEEIG